MNQLLSPDYWKSFFEQSLTWIISVLPSLLLIILLLFASLRLLRFMIRNLSGFIARRTVSHDDPASAEIEKRVKTLMGIVKNLGRVVIWGVFIMIILRKLGIDIAPILAGAGILGLAVGFGSQELVRDVISGFFILLEDQVRTGDVAVINGQGGLVEKIELRTITLRDLSGNVHIFQNGKINSLSNMTKEWSAMVFDIGVAYKEDTDRVIQVMHEVGHALKEDPEWGPKILEPVEVLGLDRFGDSAVVIKARLKTLPSEQWATGREYRRRLKKAFDEKGIEIPFPQQVVYWKGNESESLVSNPDS